MKIFDVTQLSHSKCTKDALQRDTFEVAFALAYSRKLEQTTVWHRLLVDQACKLCVQHVLAVNSRNYFNKITIHKNMTLKNFVTFFVFTDCCVSFYVEGVYSSDVCYSEWACSSCEGVAAGRSRRHCKRQGKDWSGVMQRVWKGLVSCLTCASVFEYTIRGSPG